MAIVVNSNYLKIYHARKGYNRVFGLDVDQRKVLDDDQAVTRFDVKWDRTLQQAVKNAEVCDPEDARRKLKSTFLPYFDEDQEHREFWLEQGLFIAQLKPVDGSMPELTQLWFISSSNVDPRTLFITFDTLELRESFTRAASKLEYGDEELGKKLLMDFMETILKRSLKIK